jgi:Golgi apparatus protein 1
MRISPQFLAKLAILPLVVFFSIGDAYSQTDVAKSFVDKMLDQVGKLEKSCAKDIKKYCRTVTPGEGRMVYCMQAHEDKISPGCVYDVEQFVSDLHASTEVLKDAVNACRTDIASKCGTVQPGKGRIAACLVSNKATVSKDCADAIQKVEATGAK